VARSYEHREMYEEAYLKWSEIAAVWDQGPLGRDALLGMAEDKLKIYNRPRPARRHLYDMANLTAARSYYRRLKDLYPEDANAIDADRILSLIDQDIATKQLKVGQYYLRTGKPQAANLYFDMVVQNWPQTEAAQTAREWLAAKRASPGKGR